MLKLKKLSRLSLRTKLLILVFSTITVLVMICLWLVTNLQQQSSSEIQRITLNRVSDTLRTEWIKETQALAITIADLLVQHVYTLDISGINRIAVTIQNQEPVNYIIVVNRSRRTLGSGDPHKNNLGLLLTQFPGDFEKTTFRWRTKDNLKSLEVITPIHLADEILGAVIIGFSTQAIDAETHDMDNVLADLFKNSSGKFITSIFIYGTIIVLIGVLIAYIIAHQTIAPILELVKQTKKIRSGNFTIHLDNARQDEIGILNRSVVSMAQKLQLREQNLQQAKQELEDRVQERTEELKQMNAKLLHEIEEHQWSEQARISLEKQLQHSQKMEALGTLAGGVAHDLNNILTGIVGYPDLVLHKLPEDSPIKSHIETIKTSGEKASAIVQDLLTLARRGVLQRETCNINAILEDLLSAPEWEQIMRDYLNVTITKDLAAELMNISGSGVHLSKAFMNLLINGVESIVENGIVSISTKNSYITRPVGKYEDVRHGMYVVVTISDTGIGIEEDDLTKIFEPFYTKKKMGKSGTGLGMAVVWGTVKDHDGYIDVQSAPGKGSTFQLYFPVSQEPIGLEAVQPSLADFKGNAKILVIDDDKVQREIANEILDELGYEVHLAASGEEAIDIVSENSFDLIILDMIMGAGIDGLETFRAITRLNPDQKAIITSGFSESGRVKEAQRLGAGPYLKKPYQLITLAKAVQDELLIK